MKKYEKVSGFDPAMGGHYSVMEEQEDGGWVKIEDVEEIMEDLISDLKRRALACNEMKHKSERVEGKSFAYIHSRDMVKEAFQRMKDEFKS